MTTQPEVTQAMTPRPMSLCNCRYKGGYASDTLHWRGFPGCKYAKRGKAPCNV